VLQDGPPYANGALHIGHALNKILKDMILRHKVQTGHRVEYRPGWDCHGLPIELKALAAYNSGETSTPSKAGEAEQDESKGYKSREANRNQIRPIAKVLAQKEVERQMAEFKGFGIMADWEGRWTTMDHKYEMAQLRIFQKMVEKGLISRRFRPGWWSPSTGTALAEAELEYRDDHVSKTVYFKIPLDKESHDRLLRGGRLAGLNKLSLLVWTTTPWTLVANRAVAVHDELEYAIIEDEGEGLIVTADRAEELQKKIAPYGDGVHRVGLRGSQLRGLSYEDIATVKMIKTRNAKSDSEHKKRLVENDAKPTEVQTTPEDMAPREEQQIQRRPVIHADFVSAHSGTGLVHVAPAHGHDDFEVCRPLNLDMSQVIDDGGRYTMDAWPAHPEQLKGLSVIEDGGAKVIELLGNQVVHTEDYKHRYPYDWRTKKPVIIRATEQWFADVGSIRENALKALDSVDFVPNAAENRLRSFVKERSEWCISRQRRWGVPIPALLDVENASDSETHMQQRTTVSTAHMTPEIVEHILGVMENRGTDRWYTDHADDEAWIPPRLRDKSNGVWRRSWETMDVWFDSGSSWALMGKQADIYLEGSDQHRGWFQSSLLTWIAAMETKAKAGLESEAKVEKSNAPFRTLITHGFTLDDQGRKMSKSLGNIVSPADIMSGRYLAESARSADPEPVQAKGKKQAKKPGPSHLGPDVLRLWVASSDFTSDVSLSPAALRNVEATLIKLRTTIKMLLGVLNPDAPGLPLTAIDYMAYCELQATLQAVHGFYQEHNFSRALAAITKFVNTSISAMYFESSKDRLYCGDGGGIAEHLLFGLLRMLVPMTPVLVEEAWTHLPAWMAQRADPPKHPFQQGWDDQLIAIPGFEPKLNAVSCDMDTIYALREGVNASLEKARAQKLLTRSLDAEAWIEAKGNKPFVDVVQRYAAELPDLLGVSGVHLNGVRIDEIAPGSAGRQDPPQRWEGTMAEVPVNGVTGRITLGSPEGHKCVRCWRCVAPREESMCKRCEGVFEEFMANVAKEAKEVKEDTFQQTLSGQAAKAA
jgi:isoleucyl-tRNA synthetase